MQGLGNVGFGGGGTAATIAGQPSSTNSARMVRPNRLGSQAKSGNRVVARGAVSGTQSKGSARSLGGQRTAGHQSLYVPSVGDRPIGRTTGDTRAIPPPASVPTSAVLPVPPVPRFTRPAGAARSAESRRFPLLPLWRPSLHEALLVSGRQFSPRGRQRVGTK